LTKVGQAGFSRRFFDFFCRPESVPPTVFFRRSVPAIEGRRKRRMGTISARFYLLVSNLTLIYRR